MYGVRSTQVMVKCEAIAKGIFLALSFVAVYVKRIHVSTFESA
jgi:hypothetical protein